MNDSLLNHIIGVYGPCVVKDKTSSGLCCHYVYVGDRRGTVLLVYSCLFGAGRLLSLLSLFAVLQLTIQSSGSPLCLSLPSLSPPLSLSPRHALFLCMLPIFILTFSTHPPLCVSLPLFLLVLCRPPPPLSFSFSLSDWIMKGEIQSRVSAWWTRSYRPPYWSFILDWEKHVVWTLMLCLCSPLYSALPPMKWLINIIVPGLAYWLIYVSTDQLNQYWLTDWQVTFQNQTYIP